MVGRSLKACNLWTSQPVSQSASQPECVDYFGRPSASRLWRQSVKFTGEPQRGRFKGRSHRQAHTATAAPNTDSTILLNPSPALHHHPYIFTLSRSRNISATMANLFNSARTAFRAAVNGSAASVGIRTLRHTLRYAKPRRTVMPPRLTVSIKVAIAHLHPALSQPSTAQPVTSLLPGDVSLYRCRGSP